ncbi:MAG: glycosyltransferase [Candidatus Bathyarchaeia archaeon]
MRVGVFCPTLNVYGGGEFVTVVIANTLAQNNYDVILFINEEINQREIEKFFGKSLDPSIKAIVKPSRVQQRGLLDFYQTIFRSYIFKSKCDIWIDSYSNCVFPWTNVTYIHFPFLNHYYYRPGFPYLKSGSMRALGGLPYSLFEKNFANYNGKLILANSHYTADEIGRFSGKKAEVLYPPVPSIIFNSNPETLTKNQRKNLVVTISRFGPDKGLEKIPHIASLTDAGIEFAIIGRVHYRDTLLSLQKLTEKLGLKDRVKFFPDASRMEMKQILKKAKIYLHTMIGEHFGISIVEAMAMGCIPIIHDSGGAKEFVPKDFRYRTVHEAAEKITKEIYEWSSEKAIKTVKIAEKFREENFSSEFMKLFKRYAEKIF